MSYFKKKVNVYVSSNFINKRRMYFTHNYLYRKIRIIFYQKCFQNKNVYDK